MKRNKEVSLESQRTQHQSRGLVQLGSGSRRQTLVATARQVLALACATLAGFAAQTRAATWYVPALVTNSSPYRFSAIGAGRFHSLAIQTNGTVLAWGDNSYGQCNVPTNLAGAIAVAGTGAI